MNNTNNAESGVPLEKIEAFESTIQHKLPDDYRTFLLRHNGGLTQNMVVYVPTLQVGITLRDLFELDRLIWWFSELNDELAGSHHIPIGSDKGGNPMTLNLANGWVYYWDRVSYYPETSSDRDTFWVADSFNEFLEGLQDEDSYLEREKEREAEKKQVQEAAAPAKPKKKKKKPGK